MRHIFTSTTTIRPELAIYESIFLSVSITLLEKIIMIVHKAYIAIKKKTYFTTPSAGGGGGFKRLLWWWVKGYTTFC